MEVGNVMTGLIVYTMCMQIIRIFEWKCQYFKLERFYFNDL